MVGRVVDRGAPHAAHAEVAGQRHEPRQALAPAFECRPVDRACLAGLLVGVAPAEQEPALLEPPVQPGADVEHHRHALDGEGLVSLEHRDRVARRAGRDAQPGQPADLAQRRAAGQQHTFGRDRAGVGLDPDDPGPVEAEPSERRPLAQLHARRLHRERVRPDVPRRVDRAVGRQEAAPAMTGCCERRDDLDGLLAGQPADVEPLAPLHRDAFAPGPFVVVGDREDQVAELAEAGIRPVGRLLAAIERDGPLAERDRRRRAALCPDDACRAGRGAHPEQAALEHDNALEARGFREDRRPAADRPAADDDQVCRFGHRGRPPYPTSTRAATPRWSLG